MQLVLKSKSVRANRELKEMRGNEINNTFMQSLLVAFLILIFLIA